MSGRVAKWIIEGEAFYKESKTDLTAAKLLAGSTAEGIEKRRLYFLQQALEKAVKSFMPIMIVMFRGSIRMAAYRMEFDEGKDIDQEASAILRARIEAFAHSMTNAKGLGHDPGENLHLKVFVEDLYLYLKSMALPKDEITTLRHAIESFEAKDILVLISKIDYTEHERMAITNKGLKRLEQEKPKVKSMMEVIQVFDELSFPIFLYSMVELILYISLLSHLTKYEQSFRYPDQRAIPKQILDNINIVERQVEKFIGFFEPFLNNKKLLGLYDKMYSIH